METISDLIIVIEISTLILSLVIISATYLILTKHRKSSHECTQHRYHAIKIETLSRVIHPTNGTTANKMLKTLQCSKCSDIMLNTTTEVN